MAHLSFKNRSWVWHERGEPEGLSLEERSVRAPSSGEVLIANHAIGLNPVDWKLIDWGHPAWNPGHVPGLDGAGVVIAAGDHVHIPVGTRVAYHQALGWDGSFADYTAVDARTVFPIPDGMDYVAAAAVPCPSLTAYQAIAKIPSPAGRDILVTGAGGSVGSILAQLAVQAGARVWVTSSPSHRDTLLATGVSGVFDYHDTDWHSHLATALGPRRLYAAIDTVSGKHAASLAKLLGFNGHLVCIQDRVETNPLDAFTTAISLHEIALNSVFDYGTDSDWRDWRLAAASLLDGVQTGKLRLPSIETSAFSSLPATLATLKNGTRKAKFVVTLEPEGRTTEGLIER